MALLAVASLLATAACGSTVQQDGATALAGGLAGAGAVEQGLASDATGGTDAFGLPASSGTSADGGSGGTGTGDAVAGASGGGRTGGSGGPSGGAAQQPGATGSGSAGGVSGGAALGPGITAKSILLGIPYCGDCDGAEAALGAAGAPSADPREYYKAALAEVNSRGGVLGRKLVPVFHEISASDSFDRSSQEACETFTKDNKVFAMFLRGEIASACARKAGIINIGELGSGPSYARNPNTFHPTAVSTERLGQVTVRAMVRQGWHKPEPTWPTGRIGLITWETNDYKYGMEKGYLAALRAAGLKETEVRYVAVPQSDKSLGDASAAISSAILSFREKGIDHVFIGDGPAGVFASFGLTFLFLNSAKSQQYFPRYGFNTANGPSFTAHPADQKVGMLAIDGNDGGPAADEGIALNPQRERCVKVMEKASLPIAGDTILSACETAWLTEAILKRARGTLLPEVISAAEALGSSYRSPSAFGTRFSARQHDGGALFRNSKWDQGCECMTYTSKPYEP